MVMPKLVLLKSTDHSIWCTVVLRTLTGCQLKVFLPSKRKDLLYNILNEVSALAWLAFYENFDQTRK